MNLVSRAAAVSACALALTVPAVGAHAGGYNWKTLATVSGGKIQACKLPTTTNGPWKIKFRVDATRAAGKVSGVATVTKNDNNTKDKWTSGWVAKGRVSTIGTVTLPKDSKYAINAGIGSGQMGDGGSFNAGDIKPCS